MRILTLTNLYPSPFQPQRATFNREQVRALARDHAVSVIAPIAWTDELAARRAGMPSLPPGRQLEWDGLSVQYPRVWFVPRVLRGQYGRCFQWSVARVFRRAVRAFRPDLVFATWAYPDGWAGVQLAREAGLPVVLKVHGSDVLELDKHPSRRRGTVDALRGADQIVTVSRDLTRRVIELGAEPDRVHLIYNGVDSDVFCPGDRAEARHRLGLDPAKPALLYVGNLVPVKGPDILLEACVLLRQRGIGFDLHVIGKGAMRPQLEQLATAQGIAERVRFHGSIPHVQLADWFRAATMLVLPSRSEGVPNVILEAAACGTPFVASRVGGVPEVAHLGTSYLFEPGNVIQLADRIVEVLAGMPVGRVSGECRSHAMAAAELVKVFESVLDPCAVSSA